jgi:hypothetical protein
MMPVDLYGNPVWKAQLQGVSGLANFSLIIFATESPDTARAWIEQAGSRLPDSVPMVALVSAQAEPLVRPYADAHPPQLEGMVSGLLGAAAYEGAAEISGPASLFWSPFSFGMLVSSLLAFMMIVFNLVTARLSRRKQSAGSEGKA